MAHSQQTWFGGNEQYFTSQPSSEDNRRTMTVKLAEQPRTVEVSRGVFSSSRLDLGTSVLLRLAPQPPNQGTFLDLGCGWGSIALHLALMSPDAHVWAIDINERALDLTRRNAALNAAENITTSLEQDLPKDVSFDLIWSNPPIRVGKDALHQLLMTYLPRLTSPGAAYLVVQRNLGSDSLISWLQNQLPIDWTISKYASSKGYRIIEVARP